MGNSGNSKQPQVHIPHQEKLEELFLELCDYSILSRDLFMRYFSGPTETVTCNLFSRYFIDLINSSVVTRAIFAERANHIINIEYESKVHQVQFYFDLMTTNNPELSQEDIRVVLTDCFKYGMLQANYSLALEQDVEVNDLLIVGLLNSCMDGKPCIQRESFITWVLHSCPTLFSGLQGWLHYKFLTAKMKGQFEMLSSPIECSSSNVMLSDTVLWFLCCMLPTCFTSLENKFKVSEDDGGGVENMDYTWNLLFDSNQHGLSLNRFKHRVMAYKSPTVTLIEFQNGVLVALALDQHWIDSPEKFGGPYTKLLQISPKMELVEGNSHMVYLKETGRAVPTGLLIGSEIRPKLKLATDLSTATLNYVVGSPEVQVERMEVWGCGGVEAIRSQADMKRWERNEIERRKKVKLPGQWDADKTILEMGGVRVNHSQRGDI